MSVPSPEVVLVCESDGADNFGLGGSAFYFTYFTPTVNMKLSALQVGFFSIGNAATKVFTLQLFDDNAVLGSASASVTVSGGYGSVFKAAFNFSAVISLAAYRHYWIKLVNAPGVAIWDSPWLWLTQTSSQRLGNVWIDDSGWVDTQTSRPYGGAPLSFWGIGELLLIYAGFSGGVFVHSGLSHRAQLQREVHVGLIAGLGFTRRFCGARGWLAQAFVGSGFMRRFTTVRRFVATMPVFGGWSRMFRSLRTFPVVLGLRAELEGWFICVRGFVSSVSLSEFLSVFRVAALRQAAFSAAASAQVSVNRSVEVARRVLSSLGLSWGVSRLYTALRDTVASARLVSVAAVARPFALRVVEFTAMLKTHFTLARQTGLTRQIPASLKLNAAINRLFYWIRDFTAQLPLAGWVGPLSGKLRSKLKLFEIQPSPPSDYDNTNNTDEDDDDEDDDEVDGKHE